MTRLRRRVLLAAPAIALLVAAVGVAGCGGDHGPDAATAQPAAPSVTSRVILSGNIPRVTPADFRGPTAVYRRHVRATLRAMLGDVARLRAAVAAGDLRAARRAWLAADERYETIGAAYGAFGALDAAVNGRPAGLAGGTTVDRGVQGPEGAVGGADLLVALVGGQPGAAGSGQVPGGRRGPQPRDVAEHDLQPGADVAAVDRRRAPEVRGPHARDVAREDHPGGDGRGGRLARRGAVVVLAPAAGSESERGGERQDDDREAQAHRQHPFRTLVIALSGCSE